MTSSDKDLFSNMALRDPRALSTLYDLYSQFVFGYCYFFDRTVEHAEADTQTIFVELWRAAEAYQEWPFSTMALLKSRIEILCAERHALVIAKLARASSKIKVLYVEDHTDTREMTASILRGLGYDVLVATAVNDAISLRGV